MTHDCPRFFAGILAGAVLLAASQSTLAELIENGNFYQGTIQWQTVAVDELTGEVAVIEVEETPSPFKMDGEISSTSLRIADGAEDEGGAPGIANVFSAVTSGKWTFQFDFQFPDGLPESYGYCALLGSGSIYFYLGLQKSFVVRTDQGAEAINLLIEPNTWYRVTVKVDCDAGLYSGQLETQTSVVGRWEDMGFVLPDGGIANVAVNDSHFGSLETFAPPILLANFSFHESE